MRGMKVLVGLAAASLCLVSSGRAAIAASCDELNSLISQEYVAGRITDMSLRDNLISIINSAKAASTQPQKDSLLESFRMVVGAQKGLKITIPSATMLTDESNSVGTCL